MQSDLPKVLHEILGKPLISYSLDLVRGCSSPLVVVVGHGRDRVMKALQGQPVEFAVQEPQLGTGHAIMTARDLLARAPARDVIILPGDMPLIRRDSISGLVEAYRTSSAQAGILTATLDDPTGYGRIVRDDSGGVARIVEHHDAKDRERSIREINTSVYVMDKSFLLSAVERLRPDNAKAEFYLTDVIPMAERVVAFSATDPDEAHGINSREQLARAQRVMQRRINRSHMERGVTIEDPDTVWIGPDAAIEADARLWPGVSILGASRVGRGATIMPNAWVEDSVIGHGSVIGNGSVLKGARIPEGTTLPPFSVIGAG